MHTGTVMQTVQDIQSHKETCKNKEKRKQIRHNSRCLSSKSKLHAFTWVGLPLLSFPVTHTYTRTHTVTHTHTHTHSPIHTRAHTHSHGVLPSVAPRGERNLFLQFRTPLFQPLTAGNLRVRTISSRHGVISGLFGLFGKRSGLIFSGEKSVTV